MTLPDLQNLTPREIEILTLIAEGRSLMQIAQSLHRSLKTIESHRLSLGKKLNAGNRVELAKIAIAHGLVSLPNTANQPPPGESQPISRSVCDDPIARGWQIKIDERVHDLAGTEYLNELSDAICDLTGSALTGVCVLEQHGADDPIIRSLAYSKRGQMADQFCYKLVGTPCEVAIDKGFFLITEKVSQAFPEDALLAKLHAESYAGIRLRHRNEQPIGVLWVIDDKPNQQAQPLEQLLASLKPRASSTVAALESTRKTLILCEQRAEELSLANRSLTLKNHHLDQIATYYSKLAERMQDGLVVLDQEYRIQYANEKFGEIVGRKRDDVIGQSADMMLTPESREAFYSMQQDRQADTMQHYQATVAMPDGSSREILVAPRAIFDEDGQFAGSFAVITDLADMRRAKKQAALDNSN